MTLLIAGLLTGCVHTREVPPPGVGNPAYAEEEQVPFTPPDNPFRQALQPVGDGAAADQPSGEHAGHGAQMSNMPKQGMTVYSCPMHPEVRSDRPGTCPKCGMQLVPHREHEHMQQPGKKP